MKWRDQGAIAPPDIESFLFGITRLGSKSIFMPNPWQSGHAPKGLLNENMRGVNSIRFISHLGHAKFLLKIISSPLYSIRTRPFDSLRAVSIESAILDFDSGFIVSRSTIISILCLICLSSSISSSVPCILPSILTFVYPFFAN